MSPVINARWQKLGGAAGPLGCPISDEMDTPPGTSAHYKGRFVQYQNGQIVFSPSTGPQSLQIVIVYNNPTQHIILFEWGPTTPFNYDKFIVRWNIDGQNAGQQDIGGSRTDGTFKIQNADFRRRYSIIVEGCDNGTFGSDCKQGWSNEAYVGASGPQQTQCSPHISAFNIRQRSVHDSQGERRVLSAEPQRPGPDHRWNVRVANLRTIAP